MPSTIYLALGSNVGDRLANLKATLRALPPEVRILERSGIYETAPWGYTEQEPFLNMAIKAETELAPRELLATLKTIEEQVGRTPTFKNGPREIDIDILFYGNRPYDGKDLTIPHPRLHERAFVLVPLADIAFEHVHPRLKVTIGELLTELPPADLRAIHEVQPAA